MEGRVAALVDRACAGGKPRRPYAGLELDVDVPVGDGIVDVAESVHPAPGDGLACVQAGVAGDGRGKSQL